VRKRLVLSTILIVLVVLAAIAVPIGLLVYRAAEEELRGRLQTQASQIVDDLAADAAAGRPFDLAEVSAGLTDTDGIRIVTADGTVLLQQSGGDLDDPLTVVEVGPEGIRIELSGDTGSLNERFGGQLATLGLLALGAVLAAAALAALQARQLARPLERLATSAARIGDGDFSTTSMPTTKISEIDRIGLALQQSANRVDRLLAMERSFTADATHQLRTGLAGILMRFELLSTHRDRGVRRDAEAGLKQTEQLNRTIDELLASVRDTTLRERGEFDLVELVDTHVTEWQPRFAGAGRTIAVVTASQRPVVGTKGLAGQVLDILVDNALKHGRGAVTLLIDGASVLVIDQGTGLSDEHARRAFDAPTDPAAAHGRGLPLARRLAEVDGGFVEIVHPRPLRIRYRLTPAGSEPVRLGTVIGDDPPQVVDRTPERTDREPSLSASTTTTPPSDT
jgi:signal transduction histidine kinase